MHAHTHMHTYTHSHRVMASNIVFFSKSNVKHLSGNYENSKPVPAEPPAEYSICQVLILEEERKVLKCILSLLHKRLSFSSEAAAAKAYMNANASSTRNKA